MPGQAGLCRESIRGGERNANLARHDFRRSKAKLKTRLTLLMAVCSGELSGLHRDFRPSSSCGGGVSDRVSGMAMSNAGLGMPGSGGFPVGAA